MIKSKSVILFFIFIFVAGIVYWYNNDADIWLYKKYPEIKKVLKHYKKDKRKYEAAKFLIDNMAFYFSYKGDALTDYVIPFKEYAMRTVSPKQIMDSLQRAGYSFSANALEKECDLRAVSSELLINNIDWAFKVWEEQPWCKHISFEGFCEYILPYKIKDEPLDAWREELYHKYNPLLDSIRNLPQAEDPLFVAQFLMDHWLKEPYKWTGLFPEGPHLGAIVTELKTGSCRELTDGMIYILRSIGVPCGTDMVIQRGETNASHFWCFVLDKEGNTHISEPAVWSLPEKLDIKRAKVVRLTYSLNKERWNELKKFKNVYPSFISPMYKDVTDVYARHLVHRLEIPMDSLYTSALKRKTLYYLCLSNRERWIPVDYTEPKNNVLVFNNVESGVVAAVGSWENNQLQIISDPFLIDSITGNVHFYHSEGDIQEVCLFNKYSIYVGDFVDRMIGGVIEGSHTSNFMNSDTLHLIKEAPERLVNVVAISDPNPYRYIRYKGRDGSYSNIAELQIFENITDSVPLQGNIMGTPGSKHGDGQQEYTNVFDGDFYTSFNYKSPDNGWAGLDLKKSRKISKIVYVPRNRDNFVRKGDAYELFYWKTGKWISLGKQTATSDSLLYNVPQNSLLYLKNTVRGKDERIFEYREGKQIFW